MTARSETGGRVSCGVDQIDVAATLVWNERNAVAREAYRRAPLAASKVLADGKAWSDLRRGLIDGDEYRARRAEVAAW